MTTEKKADYILYISQKITWANQDQIKIFTIGIYNDSEIEETLKLQAKNKKFHNHPIQVVSLSPSSPLTNVNMIYINKLKANLEITDLVTRIKGENILLISENYEFHKSMINFIEHKGLLRFEMNTALLESEGFKSDPLFAAKAIKSESSWVNIYLETEKKLAEEHKIVKKQKSEIQEQKTQIDKQQRQINRQERRINKQLRDINLQEQKIENQRKSLNKLQDDILNKQKILDEKMKLLEMQKNDIMRQQKEIIKQNNILSQQKGNIKIQENKIKEQKQVLNDQLAKIKMQNLIIYLGILIIILVLIASLYIYRSYRIKKQANKMLEQKNEEIMLQNEQIMQQKEEIEAQRDEIEVQRDEIINQKDIAIAQRDEITLQKQEITDSIRYAQRIQLAVLPPVGVLENIAPNNYFILNLPRDIVSGDYYWMVNFHEYFVVAAADCTGHGVPGAFMSMLGVSFLNEIMNNLIDEKHPIPRANEILMKLREKVIKSLHQTGAEGEQKDGMDIALFVIDHKTRLLQFSGANNPFYLIKNNPSKLFKTQTGDHEVSYLPGGEEAFAMPFLENSNHYLMEIKGDKMPIGIHTDPNSFFTNNMVQIEAGDTFYIFSDGFADQFGGPKNKKFKYKPMKNLLLSIQDKTMSEQKEILLDAFVEWKGDYFQIDDVLLIGMRAQSNLD